MSRPKKHQTEEDLREAQRSNYRLWLSTATHYCPCSQPATRRYSGDYACERCIKIEQENEKRNSTSERYAGQNGTTATGKYGSETYRLALRGIGT